MKTPAIICQLWESNWPAVVQMLRQSPVVLLCFRNTYSEDQRAAVVAAGGRLVDIESLLDDTEVAQLAALATDTEQRTAEAFQQTAWADYCSDKPIPADTLAEIVSGNLQLFLKQSYQRIDALERCLEHFDIRLVALNEEYSEVPSLLMQWAKQHHLQTLHLMHSVPKCRPYAIHERADADHYAVGSAITVDWLADLGVNPDRVHVTGFPGWDAYAPLLPEKASIKRNLGARLGIDPEPMWLTYFTTWASATSAFVDPEIYQKDIRSVLEACGAAWAAGREFHLIIKDRPQNLHFGKRMIDALVRTLKLPKHHIHYSADKTHELLVASSLVISSGSNLSIEAGMAGIPAVTLLDESQWLLGPCWADCGLPELEGYELSEWLVSQFDALDGPSTFGLQPIERFASPSGDGQSTQRVAALLAELAELGESVGDGMVERLWQRQGRNEHPPIATSQESSAHLLGLLDTAPQRVLILGNATGATASRLRESWEQVACYGVEFGAAPDAQTGLDGVLPGTAPTVDVAGWRLPAGCFDTLIINDVLERLYNPWQFMLDIHELLNPGARVIVSVANVRSIQMLTSLAAGHWSYGESGPLGWDKIRFFSREELTAMLVQTGYQVGDVVRHVDGKTPMLDFSNQSHLSVNLGPLALHEVDEHDWADLRTEKFVARAIRA